MEKLTPFVPFSTYNASNPFGARDEKYYPTTKHHIGTDFKVAAGTNIVAPKDGEVIKAVWNNARGNTCVFLFTVDGIEWGLELCHLKALPPLGKFSRGQVIAISGNTGSATTGAHLHAVMHRGAQVTKNYTELVDEAAFFRLWDQSRLVDTYAWFMARM